MASMATKHMVTKQDIVHLREYGKPPRRKSQLQKKIQKIK